MSANPATTVLTQEAAAASAYARDHGYIGQEGNVDVAKAIHTANVDIERMGVILRVGAAEFRMTVQEAKELQQQGRNACWDRTREWLTEQVEAKRRVKVPMGRLIPSSSQCAKRMLAGASYWQSVNKAGGVFEIATNSHRSALSFVSNSAIPTPLVVGDTGFSCPVKTIDFDVQADGSVVAASVHCRYEGPVAVGDFPAVDVLTEQYTLSLDRLNDEKQPVRLQLRDLSVVMQGAKPFFVRVVDAFGPFEQAADFERLNKNDPALQPIIQKATILQCISCIDMAKSHEHLLINDNLRKLRQTCQAYIAAAPRGDAFAKSCQAAVRVVNYLGTELTEKPAENSKEGMFLTSLQRLFSRASLRSDRDTCFAQAAFKAHLMGHRKAMMRWRGPHALQIAVQIAMAVTIILAPFIGFIKPRSAVVCQCCSDLFPQDRRTRRRGPQADPHSAIRQRRAATAA